MRDPRDPRKIDDFGRCPDCLIKPLVYRRDRHLFCHRCCRSYDMENGEQVNGSMWKCQPDGTFEPEYPNSDYVTASANEATRKRAALTESKRRIVTPGTQTSDSGE